MDSSKRFRYQVFLNANSHASYCYRRHYVKNNKEEQEEYEKEKLKKGKLINKLIELGCVIDKVNGEFNIDYLYPFIICDPFTASKVEKLDIVSKVTKHGNDEY